MRSRPRPRHARAPRSRAGRRRRRPPWRCEPAPRSRSVGRALARAMATSSPPRWTHFDEARAQAVLDRVLAAVTVDTLLARWSSPTYMSSASGGGAARPRSPRSISRRGCCAAGCSVRSRLGPRAGPGGRARLPPRRAARSRADRLRARAASHVAGGSSTSGADTPIESVADAVRRSTPLSSSSARSIPARFAGTPRSFGSSRARRASAWAAPAPRRRSGRRAFSS